MFRRSKADFGEPDTIEAELLIKETCDLLVEGADEGESEPGWSPAPAIQRGQPHSIVLRIRDVRASAILLSAERDKVFLHGALHNSL